MGYETDELRCEFQQLTQPISDLLYQRALGYTKNTEDAQDLVQETFERAYKSFSSFQRGSNIEAWLMTILRNTYFNHYKKKKHSPQYQEIMKDTDNKLFLEDMSDMDAVSAETAYLRTKMPHELDQALEKLPEERRKVFTDIVLNGKTYKEVAEEEHVKIGTVMSRLSRARQQLKQELSDLKYGM